VLAAEKLAEAARQRAEAARRQAETAQRQAEAAALLAVRARERAEGEETAARRRQATGRGGKKHLALAAKERAEAERRELAQTLRTLAGQLDVQPKRDDLLAAVQQLTSNWAPEQLLAVWHEVLQDHDHKAFLPQALDHSARVLQGDGGLPSVRALARCVRGLALRNQGRCADARHELELALQVPQFTSVEERHTSALKALGELTPPAGYYLGRARALQQADQFTGAVAVLDAGLAEFPGDGALLALRSHARLGLARQQGGKLTLANALVRQALDDATAAAGSGRYPGLFAAGRVLEDLAIGPLPRDVIVRPSSARGRRPTRLAAWAWLASCTTATPRSSGVALRGGRARDGCAQGNWPPRSRRLCCPHRCARALQAADDAVRAGHGEGYLIKTRIYAARGLWVDALREHTQGMKHLVQPAHADYAADLGRITAKHPGLTRPALLPEPDPVLAAKHYGKGLEYYFKAEFSRPRRRSSRQCGTTTRTLVSGTSWGLPSSVRNGCRRRSTPSRRGESGRIRVGPASRRSTSVWSTCRAGRGSS